jgi:hypothetical protein
MEYAEHKSALGAAHMSPQNAPSPSPTTGTDKAGHPAGTNCLTPVYIPKMVLARHRPPASMPQLQRKDSMMITLWAFRPPKRNKKRWSLLSHGSLPALQSDTRSTPCQRTATVHNAYCSILMHALQIVFIPAKRTHSRNMGMFGHQLVCSCPKRSALRRTAMGGRARWAR